MCSLLLNQMKLNGPSLAELNETGEWTVQNRFKFNNRIWIKKEKTKLQNPWKATKPKREDLAPKITRENP